jgi:hypothetical protein
MTLDEEARRRALGFAPMLDVTGGNAPGVHPREVRETGTPLKRGPRAHEIRAFDDPLRRALDGLEAPGRTRDAPRDAGSSWVAAPQEPKIDEERIRRSLGTIRGWFTPHLGARGADLSRYAAHVASSAALSGFIELSGVGPLGGAMGSHVLAGADRRDRTLLDVQRQELARIHDRFFEEIGGAGRRYEGGGEHRVMDGAPGLGERVARGAADALLPLRPLWQPLFGVPPQPGDEVHAVRYSLLDSDGHRRIVAFDFVVGDYRDANGRARHGVVGANLMVQRSRWPASSPLRAEYDVVHEDNAPNYEVRG